MVDEELLNFPAEVLQVVVTNPAYCGLTGVTLPAPPQTRLIVVRSVKRGGQLIPLGFKTVLEAGDVVELFGHSPCRKLAKLLGYPLRPSSSTPLSIIGLGIVLGGIIGAPFLMLNSLKLTISVTVGVLLLGVAAGVLTSIRPMFPRLPRPLLSSCESGPCGFFGCQCGR